MNQNGMRSNYSMEELEAMDDTTLARVGLYRPERYSSLGAARAQLLKWPQQRQLLEVKRRRRALLR